MLGQALINELAARGRRGSFFDYQGYQELRRVETPAQLRAFLDQHGYRHIAVSDDPAQIIAHITDHELDAAITRIERIGKWRLLDSILDPIGALFALGFLAIAKIARRAR